MTVATVMSDSSDDGDGDDDGGGKARRGDEEQISYNQTIFFSSYFSFAFSFLRFVFNINASERREVAIFEVAHRANRTTRHRVALFDCGDGRKLGETTTRRRAQRRFELADVARRWRQIEGGRTQTGQVKVAANFRYRNDYRRRRRHRRRRRRRRPSAHLISLLLLLIAAAAAAVDIENTAATTTTMSAAIVLVVVDLDTAAEIIVARARKILSAT